MLHFVFYVFFDFFMVLIIRRVVCFVFIDFNVDVLEMGVKLS